MDLSVLRTVRKNRSAMALGGLLALTIGAGSVQAAGSSLILKPALTSGGSAIASTVTLACNTQTGPTAQIIYVTAATAPTGVNEYNVTVTTSPGHGIVITPPSSGTLITSTNTPLQYTVSLAAGCVGNATAAGPFALTFSYQPGTSTGGLTGSPTADASVNFAESVTVGSASGLVASGITVECKLSGGVYTAGPAQTVYVSSGATGGIPFTAASVTGLTFGGPYVTGGNVSATATGNPATFTVTPVIVSSPASCAGSTGAVGSSTTVNVVLTATGGGPTLTVPVTVAIVGPSTLLMNTSATPSLSFSYTKGSGIANSATGNVTVSGGGSVFYSVNTSTLPVWLTVNTTGGTTPSSLTFTTTSAADGLAPGSYTSTLYLKVSGQLDFPVTVTLELTNKAPKLLVNPASSTPNQISINWTLGTSFPTANIIVASSDIPLAYTITTSGTLTPVATAAVAQTAGLAYSFGSTIPVTLATAPFISATAGQVLTGTVTFTWGSPAASTVVTISVNVQSAGSTITGISPATIPTANPGQVFTLTLTGSGFIGGTDPTLKTKIGLASGGPPASITADSNFSLAFVDSGHMTLTITVPTNADANLPFTPGGGGGIVYIGVCNGVCTTATGTISFTIGAGPVITGVTSASSFQETGVSIAPYDMISIFGTSFCASGTSQYNCGTSTLLSAVPTANTLVYPTSLSNDPSGAGQRFVTVSFYNVGQESSPALATAPLLFATNGQINALVPASINSTTLSPATAVDIVVNFGYGSYGSSTLLSSSPFTVNLAAADPGIFTVSSDGQGSAAALNGTTYSLISSSNPAGSRAGTGNPHSDQGDVISLYVSGLGTPTSLTSTPVQELVSTGAGDSVNAVTCISATGSSSYFTALAAAGYGGTTIDGAIIQSSLLGSDLPPCFTQTTSGSSPTFSIGSTANNPVVKIGGVTAPVQYAGFVAGSIAGLYQINVQIPDYNSTTFYPNWTPTALGTGSFTGLTQPVSLPVYVQIGGVWSQAGVTLEIGPKLLMTPGGGITPVTSSTGSYAATVNTAVSSLGVTATEGTSSYSYAVTSGVLPLGLSLNSGTGAITGTPSIGTAGTYAVTVTATDSATIPLTGSYTINITVAGALVVTDNLGAGAQTAHPGPYGTLAPQNDATYTATGGTIPYSFAPTSPVTVSQLNALGFTLGTTSGVLQSTSTAMAGNYTVSVTATDSSSTPLTGTNALVTVSIPLAMSVTTSASPVSASDPTAVIYAVQPLGATGSVTCALTNIAGTASNTLDVTNVGGVCTVKPDATNAPANGTPISFKVTGTDTSAPSLTGMTITSGTGTTGTITVTLGS